MTRRASVGNLGAGMGRPPVRLRPCSAAFEAWFAHLDHDPKQMLDSIRGFAFSPLFRRAVDSSVLCRLPLLLSSSVRLCLSGMSARVSACSPYQVREFDALHVRVRHRGHHAHRPTGRDRASDVADVEKAAISPTRLHGEICSAGEFAHTRCCCILQRRDGSGEGRRASLGPLCHAFLDDLEALVGDAAWPPHSRSRGAMRLSASFVTMRSLVSAAADYSGGDEYSLAAVGGSAVWGRPLGTRRCHGCLDGASSGEPAALAVCSQVVAGYCSMLGLPVATVPGLVPPARTDAMEQACSGLACAAASGRSTRGEVRVAYARARQVGHAQR